MTEATAGTRTFLFTDVEGSTLLLKTLREHYADVLAEQQRLLGDAVSAHGGELVDTQGDACFFAFATATDALLAAVEGQRALAAHEWRGGEPVRVRMGLHSGRASLKDGRYHGVAVHRAARIASAAHGGQILLSQTTRELFEDEEQGSDNVALRDVGVHRVKDLERPVHLYQVMAPALARDFRAPRTGLAPVRRRRWAALGLALAVLAAAAGVAAYFAFGDGSPPPAISNNSLIRIDPKTNEVADVIPVGRMPNGVAVSGDGVWVVNGRERTVWRLDRRSSEITARVGGLEAAFAVMPDGRGGAWVVGSAGEGENASLYHLNRAGTLVRTIKLHDRAIWAATFARGFVWLTSVSDFNLDYHDYLVRVDPRIAKIKRFRVGSGKTPAGVAVTNDAIWMPNYRDDSVSRFDPNSGELDTVKLPEASEPNSVAAGAGSVWVGHENDGDLNQLDSYTGAEKDIVHVAKQGPVIVAAADEDGVWAIAPEDHALVRVSNEGLIVARIRTGPWSPNGVAISDDGVWVSVAHAGD